jgi:hypothetical protein
MGSFAATMPENCPAIPPLKTPLFHQHGPALGAARERDLRHSVNNNVWRPKTLYKVTNLITSNNCDRHLASSIFPAANLELPRLWPSPWFHKAVAGLIQTALDKLVLGFPTAMLPESTSPPTSTRAGPIDAISCSCCVMSLPNLALDLVRLFER